MTETKRILHLTLKKKWFDMIASGEKKEEYREIKPYWVKRFGYFYESYNDGSGYWDEQMKNLPDYICFTNGYGKHRPSFTIEVIDWRVGKAKREWSDNFQGNVFAFKLGDIISVTPQTTKE